MIAIIGRMLLALVVVLAVMWFLARWARKPMGAGKGDRVMTVLARQQVSRSSSVAVLKLMDRALVLGVTDQGVQLLTETELAPIEEALTVESTPRRSRFTSLAALSAGRVALTDADTDAEPDTAAAALPSIGVSATALRPAGTGAASALQGSILSPTTWKQLVGAARELTVRR